jgi:hypothetical protein
MHRAGVFQNRRSRKNIGPCMHRPRVNSLIWQGTFDVSERMSACSKTTCMRNWKCWSNAALHYKLKRLLKAFTVSRLQKVPSANELRLFCVAHCTHYRNEQGEQQNAVFTRRSAPTSIGRYRTRVYDDIWKNNTGRCKDREEWNWRELHLAWSRS